MCKWIPCSSPPESDGEYKTLKVIAPLGKKLVIKRDAYYFSREGKWYHGCFPVSMYPFKPDYWKIKEEKND